MKLNERELATLLAALHHVHNSMLGLDELYPDYFTDIEGGVLEADEREALAERLNMESPLDAIHRELDGKEWDSDTLEAVAEHLRAAGYEIREPLDDDDGIDLTDSRVAQAMGEKRGDKPS